jgi:hypothetical protein
MAILASHLGSRPPIRRKNQIIELQKKKKLAITLYQAALPHVG